MTGVNTSNGLLLRLPPVAFLRSPLRVNRLTQQVRRVGSRSVTKQITRNLASSTPNTASPSSQACTWSSTLRKSRKKRWAASTANLSHTTRETTQESHSKMLRGRMTWRWTVRLPHAKPQSELATFPNSEFDPD